MIPFAAVVSGSEVPAGDGVTGTMRCLLAVPDKLPFAGFIKRGDSSAVLAEAFCSVLLAGWGLAVPAAYFVNEPRGLAFASADADYPSLKHRFAVDRLPADTKEGAAARIAAAAMACKLPTAPLAAAADEAIDNRDRNLGNILWDGSEEQWIDHAGALGNLAGKPDINKLCAMAVATGLHEDMERATLAQWPIMDRGQPAAAATVIAPHSDCSAWQQLVTDRMAVLGQRLLARFPKPADLLSGA